MKRKLAALVAAAAMLFTLAACGGSGGEAGSASSSGTSEEAVLSLSDGQVTLDGAALAEGQDGAVTVSHDVVYYQSGMGADYGEGTEADEHTAEEAAAHTVVTIRQAGSYRVSGTLSAGQLAVDLGEEAKNDPAAVVTLILDGADITCTVAPAVIFYNVYECDTHWTSYDGEVEDYQASTTVDTSAAGANVVLADGSVNNISGAYVARIYKEGTTDKLHKYDGAFYSKMSMNMGGEAEGTGVLNITASNEGLDSELHLTVNGGVLNIQSQNDGINTNEDGVSVTTINGGTLRINAGLGDEGDAIDSNGCLVINGGEVYTAASDHSPDGGIDADLDILLNGGFVAALGTANGQVSHKSEQAYMELSFASPVAAGSQIELSDPEGQTLLSITTSKACQSITFSSDQLERDVAYSLTVDGTVQQYTGAGSAGMGGPGGEFKPQDGQKPPEKPDGQAPQKPDAGAPNGQKPPEPDGETPPQMPQGGGQTLSEPSTAFTLTDVIHAFSGISDREHS